MSESREKHPVDLAREQLFEKTPARHRDTLKSRLSLAHHQRADSSHEDAGRITQEMIVARKYGSGGHIIKLWGCAKSHADSAKTTMMAAMAAADVPREAATTFLKEDYQHFLSAFANSQAASHMKHSPGLVSRTAGELQAKASQFASRIPDEVRAAYQDYQAQAGGKWERRIKWFTGHPVISVTVLLYTVAMAIVGTVQSVRALFPSEANPSQPSPCMDAAASPNTYPIKEGTDANPTG